MVVDRTIAGMDIHLLPLLFDFPAGMPRLPPAGAGIVAPPARSGSAMNTPLTPNDSRQPDLQSLKNVAIAVYALQAASILPPFVITFFVAVILNYIKRDDVRGTWLESHFRWQLRTFWFGLLWFVLGGLTYVIVIGWAILFAASLWLIYRILKGWLNLNDGKPMNA
jgi:uncharacterized membrane protein